MEAELMNGKIEQMSILLVMKNVEFRQALILAMRIADPMIAIAGECGHGVEAINLFYTIKPCIVLMDATLRPYSFSELAGQMLAMDPSARLIGVTNVFESRRACQLVKDGAKGQIARTMSIGTMIRIIRMVARGDTVIGEDFSE